jgi:(S)-2-hydroxyglutarate dehydrogenase
MPSPRGFPGSIQPLAARALRSPTLDLAIVGAGIVGLAIARELLVRHVRLRLVVVEREQQVGLHQTTNNSGVVHAGFSYRVGSQKAKLCVEGARLLYAYCDAHDVRYERSGKVVVAKTSEEAEVLERLRRQGEANGVEGLRLLDQSGLEDIEPHAVGVSALHSPMSGVVDFAEIAEALRADIRERGGLFRFSFNVRSVAHRDRQVELQAEDGSLTARNALFCLGARADRLRGYSVKDPRLILFRGKYLRLRSEHAHLVRSMIYPVPTPGLPFLGIHFTKRIDGQVLVGPTALLAGRQALDDERLRPHEILQLIAWPGGHRMARRWWRRAIGETYRALNPAAISRCAREYVPELPAGAFIPGPVGIRAQPVGRDGSFVDDFIFADAPRSIHVRSAPSPAATAALAIARVVAERAERRFDLN